MKKIFLTFSLLLFMFLSIDIANADTFTFYYSSDEVHEFSNSATYLDLNSFFANIDYISQDDLDELYRLALIYFNEHSSDYPYYSMSLIPYKSSSGSNYDLMLWLHLYTSIPTYSSLFSCSYSVLFEYDGSVYTTNDGWNSCKPYSYAFDRLFSSMSDYTQEGPFYNPLIYYSSNFDLVFDSDDTYIVEDYNNTSLTFNTGDIIPSYYSANVADNYTTVNLDDYYYVILNLKDYSVKESFTTNFFVKGMIGITPVYSFGTSEKITITDRCNLSYDDFTSLRLSILQTDLQNNAVYYVKACEDNSSFKFDNSLFDITYVTLDNKDIPAVITIDGTDYTTIPFDDLSNSANENEENNYVPGESENFGSGSISDIMSKPLEFLEGIVTGITSFFSLITTFIGMLPIELQSFLYFSFCIAVILGIIKILL